MAGLSRFVETDDRLWHEVSLVVKRPGPGQYTFPNDTAYLRYARGEWVEKLPQPADFLHNYQWIIYATGPSRDYPTGPAGDGTLTLTEATPRTFRGSFDVTVPAQGTFQWYTPPRVSGPRRLQGAFAVNVDCPGWRPNWCEGTATP